MEKIENKPIDFYKRIYVSHGFGNKNENKQLVEDKIKKLKTKYPDYLFISPIHTFSFLYDSISYEEGLRMCLELMDFCNEVWILDENYLESKGVIAEIIFAQENNIPVYHIEI